MSQEKLAKVVLKVDGLYTPGHARRCEAMVRNSAGGIVSVKANEVMGTLEVVFDTHVLKQHSIKDIVDDTGYTVLEE